MRLKNVNLAEKHIEKALMAIAVLFALVVLLMFVLGQPYTVQMRGNEQLPLNEVERRVETAADQLNAALNTQQTPWPEIAVIPYEDRFVNRFQRSTSVETQFRVPLAQPGLDTSLVGSVQGTGSQFVRRHVPQPPAPTDLQARSGYGVIDRQAFENSQIVEQLAQHVGDPSLALRYVSVSGEFDFQTWRDVLQRVPRDDANAEPIPEEWWRNAQLVVDVILQRQQWDPQAGAWGQTTELDAMPGTISFRQTPQQYDQQTALDHLAIIRENQPVLRQTPFLPLAAGPAWIPPYVDQQQLDMDTRRQINRLTDEIERRRQRLDRLMRLAQRRAARDSDNESATRQPAAGDRRQAPDEMFDEPAGPMRDRRQPPMPRDRAGDDQRSTVDQRNNQRIAELQQEIADLRVQRSQLLGIDPDQAGQMSTQRMRDQAFAQPGDPRFERPQGPMDPTAPPRFRNRPTQDTPATDRFGRPLAGQTRPGMTPGPGQGDPNQEGPQQPDEVIVLAHDLTAEPGQTYRYRLVVKVQNPLFQQVQLPQAQREKYTDRLGLRSVPSAWTDPIEIEPDLMFFAVGSQQSQQQVEIEVWQLQAGRWIWRTFQCRPGDRIGADPSDQQQLLTDAAVVDVNFDYPAPGDDALTTRVLAMDLQTGELFERWVSIDTDSPRRQRLRNEAVLQRELAADAGMRQ